MARLSDDLVERVLEKLSVTHPSPDEDGLRAVYAAWCRGVPFDNVRKLIHMRAGRSETLPGDTADDFLEAWLTHGTGGTCWAGNGALYALLASLGFRACRGIGTMLVAENLPPNHGTVSVAFDEVRYLVDASILHGEPLLLEHDGETRVDHAAYGVRCAPDPLGWRVRWRPLHLPDGMDCRIERLGVSAAEFESMHEATRGWSPFNFQLSARLVRADEVVGVGFGQRGEIGADGTMRSGTLEGEERARYLTDTLRMSPAIAHALPQDVATPPPPGSHSAGPPVGV